jgi:hypothetical protein
VPATSLLVGTLVVTAAGLGEAVFSEPLPIVSLAMLILFRLLTLAETSWTASKAARVPTEEIFMVKV